MSGVTTGSTIDVAFPTHEIMRSPYAFYEHARALGPVVATGADQGEFLVTRYDAIREALERSDVFSNVHSVIKDGYVRRAHLADDVPTRISSFITTDAPRHTAQRKIAFHPLKPGRLRDYEAVVRRHTDELIDGFADRGEVELVREFCNPLPAAVIGDVLGLPSEDRPRFIHWSLYEGHGARYESPQRRDDGATIVREMGAYVREAMLSRYEHPRDDVLSDLIRLHAERDGEPDMPNLIADVGTLLIGGIVTSAHMMASAMMLLQRNPDQLALVQADQSLVPNMLEETIRLESPVQWQPRLIREDTEIQGVPLPADSILLALLASGNRDPEKFPDPERFDVTRADARDHLGFGFRRHFCLGAPLARLEGRVAFEQLFARLPNLRLAGDNDFAALESLVFRGPQRLKLTFDAV